MNEDQSLEKLVKGMATTCHLLSGTTLNSDLYDLNWRSSTSAANENLKPP